jgi:hypothetical protein
MAFRTATRLGWQIESNWTDPLLFAIYSVIKPVAASLILVFMYLVITRGKTGRSYSLTSMWGTPSTSSWGMSSSGSVG